MQPRNPGISTRRRRPASGTATAAALCLALSVSHASPARAERSDANILQSRAKVAEMAEKSMEMLEGQVTIEGAEGWAIFSGDRLPPDLDLGPGVGMAQDFFGEAWFLRTEGKECTSPGRRYALVFRDEDLFREFRQGEVTGETLERLRSHSPPGPVLAFEFRPVDQPQLEPMKLSGCRFALHKDLQRALVAEPSRTEGMIDEDEVYKDDN